MLAKLRRTESWWDPNLVGRSGAALPPLVVGRCRGAKGEQESSAEMTSTAASKVSEGIIDGQSLANSLGKLKGCVLGTLLGW